jgi:nucleotidyltransferase/DNA polymerase involved in DNA repair
MDSSRIFHVDMDAFFVSVEELLDPSLKGKPVVVGAQPGHRGVVAAASYEARKYGIHSAMPVSEAVRRCPHAVFLPGHSGLYSKYSHQVYQILCCYSPVVEMVSIDEGYLDMTGTERLFASAAALASTPHYSLAPDSPAEEWDMFPGSATVLPNTRKSPPGGERPLPMARDPRNLLGISIASQGSTAGEREQEHSAFAGDPAVGIEPESHRDSSARVDFQPVRGNLDSEFLMLSVASRLREEILHRTGLSASIGIGTSRLVAKVASDMAKPRGLLLVTAGREPAFLAPLKIRRIPGIGPKTEKQLNDLGVETVGDLQKLNAEFLREQFGSWGDSLAIKAQGGSDWRYLGGEDPKSISHENTFGVDTCDREQVEATLVYLVQRVGKRLRDHGLFAATIQLKLRDSKFSTITRAVTLNQPADIDAILLKNALALLHNHWDGKTPIRLIGIGVSGLGDRPRQSHLLEGEQNERLEKLYQAADSIRDKYGFDALKSPRGEKRRKK